jgi:hypothetical protein
MTETQKQIDRAMLEVTALSHIAKADGDLPTYYAANRAWHELFKAREDRSKRATALAQS